MEMRKLFPRVCGAPVTRKSGRRQTRLITDSVSVFKLPNTIHCFRNFHRSARTLSVSFCKFASQGKAGISRTSSPYGMATSELCSSIISHSLWEYVCRSVLSRYSRLSLASLASLSLSLSLTHTHTHTHTPYFFFPFAEYFTCCRHLRGQDLGLWSKSRTQQVAFHSTRV
jgi:hypothetical protein